MQFRFKSAGKQERFFAGDGSGVAMLCERTGETHFLHVDPVGLNDLLSRPDIGLDELLETLKLSDENEAEQFANQLVSLGIIDKIG